MFKIEAKTRKLLCETHKKDSIMFCKEHREWICVECLASHLSHYDKLVTGTGEDLNPDYVEDFNLCSK